MLFSKWHGVSCADPGDLLACGCEPRQPMDLDAEPAPSRQHTLPTLGDAVRTHRDIKTLEAACGGRRRPAKPGRQLPAERRRAESLRKEREAMRVYRTEKAQAKAKEEKARAKQARDNRECATGNSRSLSVHQFHYRYCTATHPSTSHSLPLFSCSRIFSSPKAKVLTPTAEGRHRPWR